MDMNNFFSFPRIVMVMKREIMENWKANMLRLIGLYAAFAIPMLLFMLKISNESRWLDNPDWALGDFCQSMMSTFMIIIGIVAFVYASNIMENMITKEKRISFLMLPATMIEKFVARFLFVTVGLLLSVWVTLSLAEITRLIFVPFFNLPETLHGTILPKMFSMFTSFIFVSGTDYYVGHEDMGSISLGLTCVLAWVYGLWLHSLYILGGNIWYKKPFFKTLGSIIVISIVLAVILTRSVILIGSDTMKDLGIWLTENLSWMSVNFALSCGIAFFLAFTLLNWWLSYRLFTRSQVIKPKFRLL